MYYNFNFNKDKEFFNQSKEYNNLLLRVTEEFKKAKYYDEELEKTINISVKLFVESVIKHNLSITSIDINPIKLIDDNNSDEVNKKIGTIINKNKDRRNNQDLMFLSKQSMIHNQICLFVYSEIDEKDIAENIKNEFIEFKKNELSNKEEKKVKPK